MTNYFFGQIFVNFFYELLINFEEGKNLFKIFQKYLPFKAPNLFWKSLKSLIFSILSNFRRNKFEKRTGRFLECGGEGGSFRALWTLSVKDSMYFDILHSTTK